MSFSQPLDADESDDNPAHLTGLGWAGLCYYLSSQCHIHAKYPFIKVNAFTEGINLTNMFTVVNKIGLKVSYFLHTKASRVPLH